MPNVISKRRKSVTLLAERSVIDELQSIAKKTNKDLSEILREATAQYCLEHLCSTLTPSLTALRAQEKRSQRLQTRIAIDSAQITVHTAQQQNAPLDQPVEFENLQHELKRYSFKPPQRNKPTKRYPFSNKNSPTVIED